MKEAVTQLLHRVGNQQGRKGKHSKYCTLSVTLNSEISLTNEKHPSHFGTNARNLPFSLGFK